MSKLLRGSVSVLAAGVMLAACANSYAAVSLTTSPYTPGTTASYGTAAGDYQSRADAFGTPSNDLLGAVTNQGGPGVSGLGNTIVGLGEIVTPQSGSTYGAPNNHGFTVNSITAPLAGGAAGFNVTMTILSGEFQDGSGNPIAPNDGTNTDVFTNKTTLFSDTFAWNPGSNPVLATFNIAGDSAAFQNGWNGVMNLGQSYIVGLSFDSSTIAAGVNGLIWYRGLSVDPGGQMVIESNPNTSSWQTFATAGFGAASPRTAAIAFNVPPSAPEPGTIVLLGLSVPALWAARRRKK